MNIGIKSIEEIKSMREGGKILAEVLATLKEKAEDGISTKELDIIAHSICRKYKVSPSFFGYGGFPGAICASVNEEIVHGIPSDRRLKNGDILSIDFGVFHKGLHTDACITFPIGEVSKDTLKLIEASKKALKKAISILRDGVHLGNVSFAIQETVEGEGFFVVRNLTGHGIGTELHENPQILNYGKKETGPILKSGMTLAIEPIITKNRVDNYTLSDEWTIVSADSCLSSHAEHTVLITKNGAEILTKF